MASVGEMRKAGGAQFQRAERLPDRARGASALAADKAPGASRANRTPIDSAGGARSSRELQRVEARAVRDAAIESTAERLRARAAGYLEPPSAGGSAAQPTPVQARRALRAFADS